MNMDDWQLDIDTPLKAIERIAQSEDRMLAIQFFLFFSRFGICAEVPGKNQVKQNSEGSGINC